jgi:hypothetical protein
LTVASSDREQQAVGEQAADAPAGGDKLPFDAYTWSVYVLLLCLVACIVLLTYLVIDLRADHATLQSRLQNVEAHLQLATAPSTSSGQDAGGPLQTGTSQSGQ